MTKGSNGLYVTRISSPISRHSLKNVEALSFPELAFFAAFMILSYAIDLLP